MPQFAVLRPKAYTYLIDDGNLNKKPKITKIRIIKLKLKF